MEVSSVIHRLAFIKEPSKVLLLLENDLLFVYN